MPTIGVLRRTPTSTTRGPSISSLAFRTTTISSAITMFAPLGLFNNLTIWQFTCPEYSGQKYKEYKMALYYELPVYRDVYKLILMIFECTKDFSKEYKYASRQDLKLDDLSKWVAVRGNEFDQIINLI